MNLRNNARISVSSRGRDTKRNARILPNSHKRKLEAPVIEGQKRLFAGSYFRRSTSVETKIVSVINATLALFTSPSPWVRRTAILDAEGHRIRRDESVPGAVGQALGNSVAAAELPPAATGDQAIAAIAAINPANAEAAMRVRADVDARNNELGQVKAVRAKDLATHEANVREQAIAGTLPAFSEQTKDGPRRAALSRLVCVAGGLGFVLVEFGGTLLYFTDVAGISDLRSAAAYNQLALGGAVSLAAVVSFGLFAIIILGLTLMRSAATPKRWGGAALLGFAFISNAGLALARERAAAEGHLDALSYVLSAGVGLAYVVAGVVVKLMWVRHCARVDEARKIDDAAKYLRSEVAKIDAAIESNQAQMNSVFAEGSAVISAVTQARRDAIEQSQAEVAYQIAAGAVLAARHAPSVYESDKVESHRKFARWSQGPSTARRDGKGQVPLKSPFGSAKGAAGTVPALLLLVVGACAPPPPAPDLVVVCEQVAVSGCESPEAIVSLRAATGQPGARLTVIRLGEGRQSLCVPSRYGGNASAGIDRLMQSATDLLSGATDSVPAEFACVAAVGPQASETLFLAGSLDSASFGAASAGHVTFARVCDRSDSTEQVACNPVALGGTLLDDYLQRGAPAARLLVVGVGEDYNSATIVLDAPLTASRRSERIVAAHELLGTLPERAGSSDTAGSGVLGATSRAIRLARQQETDTIDLTILTDGRETGGRVNLLREIDSRSLQRFTSAANETLPSEMLNGVEVQLCGLHGNELSVGAHRALESTWRAALTHAGASTIEVLDACGDGGHQ